MEKRRIRDRIRNMGFTITDVISDLKNIRDYLKGYEDEEIDDGGGNFGTDVRINSHGRGFEILSGDASFDQDHRGFWGSSWVSKYDTNVNLRETAYDLLDQLLDDKDMEKVYEGGMGT